ncbi:hypothetical protein G7066_03170 [Leucobacter coleopterorum]|uniref:LPXTG-motif cell wall anchor domain-containing protein n=1 Tax=Leucobacter coleopterorum TaxID=2714933 RepID=A0ABX6JYT1_9MICO|nr:hypothetical protein [Leucobacter coleopterorum]QIM17930.1 hypothetical protein G7066_03170 [Leucobacter coleopterorum]
MKLDQLFRVRRTPLGAAVCVVALLLLVCSGMNPTTAHASPGGLTVSHDGTNFDSNTSLPVFEDMGISVPGAQNVERVWVRNEGPATGRLQIELINPISNSSELARGFSLSIAEKDHSGTEPVSIAHGIRNGTCTVLSHEVLLNPGEVKELSLTAAIDPHLNKRDGATGTVRFQLRGVLEEAAAVERRAVGAACEMTSTQKAPLASPKLVTTGGASFVLAVWAGALGVAGGLLLGVLVRRRHKLVGLNAHPKNLATIVEAHD